MHKTILYLGQIGSNSHLAALKIKKSGDILTGKNSFTEIFKIVCGKKAHIAVIPVKNTITGPIAETANLIQKTSVKIIGNLKLKINHCLLAVNDKKTGFFKYCLSHEEVFRQCSGFLEKHKNLKHIKESDTASACVKLNLLPDNYCSIASAAAAKKYKLQVLAENIQDLPLNFTSFVIVTKKND